MNDQKINLKFIAGLIIVVFITRLIHEFAHWLTSECMGYETIMRLNGVLPDPSQHPTDLHKIITSAAGPVITIIQGLIVFVFLKFRQWNKYDILFYLPVYLCGLWQA